MLKRKLSKQNSKVSPINGLLLVNKDKNKTSHDIVDEVRKILNQKSVGHAGTLDPLAEGLLVLLLGQATKLSPYLLNRDKKYFLTLKLGMETDTWDAEGKVLREDKVSFEKNQIEQALKEATREIELPVPYFSACKVQGKRLYSYARKGQQVEIPCRKMFFYDLDVQDIQADQASLSLSCKKGGYIRSWVDYIGRSLGTRASLMELKRQASLPFHLEDSLRTKELAERLKNLQNFNEEAMKERLGTSFIYFSKALDRPFVELTGRDSKAISHGQMPSHIFRTLEPRQIQVNKEESPQLIQFVQEHHLSALAELRPFQRPKILRTFPTKRH